MADETIKINSSKTHMSQSRERNTNSRWSESHIHKYSLHSTPSDEEKASQAYSPLLKAQEKLAFACCICCEQCNGLKSSRRLAAINYKETLQVYLIRTQVEEAAMDDKQTLMQQLNLISNVFEAAVQHMQSLQVSYLAAKRVFDMSHAILTCHPSSSANHTNNDFVSYHGQIEIEKEKRMSNLRELMECCSKNIIFPKDTYALLDDHWDKRKNFFLASANFKNLLENSRLSVSQMEKLQRQHDTILKDFQQSRLLVNKELPKIMNLRLEALQQFFHKIAELFGDINYNMHAANLFELISISLCQNDSDTGKIILHEEETNKEICEKCKENHMDKK